MILLLCSHYFGAGLCATLPIADAMCGKNGNISRKVVPCCSLQTLRKRNKHGTTAQEGGHPWSSTNSLRCLLICAFALEKYTGKKSSLLSRYCLPEPYR